MPYKINHLTDLEIVDLSLRGVITGDELRDVTSKCIAIQKEYGVKKFLVCADNSEFFTTLVDIFDLADKQYPSEGVDRSTRIAVIYPLSITAKEAVSFYETTCRNRGWNAQIYSDRESAIAWLEKTEELM